jgi:receptor protein-tyrosine kinase
MTLGQVLQLIKRRLPLILLLIIVFGAGTFVYAKYRMTDYYQAYTALVVSNSDSSTAMNSLTSSEYYLNVQLTSSYRVLCKTDRVLNQVVMELNLPYSADVLRGMVTVIPVENTQIIHIYVTSASPEFAQQVANTLSTVFQKEVIEIMKMDNVQIIDEAQLPTAPIGPDRTKITLIGAAAGLVLGIGLSFFLELLNRKVKTKEQLQEALGAPILGVIPKIGKKHTGMIEQGKKPATAQNARQSRYIMDSFSKLKVNIDFSCLDCKSRCIVITSALPNEGKTLVATNLAVCMAAAGHKTLLMDADMRSPSIHSTLAISNSYGLSDVVLLRSDWHKSVVPTIVQGLYVITAGQKPPNPTRILESKLFLEMLEEMKNEYEYIVIDTPPLLPVSDSQIIAPHADGVVIVVRKGKTKIESIQQASDMLLLSNANMIGAVLNGINEKSNQYGYNYK